MKKLMFLFAAVVLLAMTSCGGSNAEAVAEKIENGDELTQADFKVMIDYCDDAADEVAKLFNDYANAQKDGDQDKIDKIESKMENLKDKYPYTQIFIESIVKNRRNLDEKNLEAFDNINKKMEEALH